MSSQQKEDQHACRLTRKKINLSRVIRKKLHVRKVLGTSRIAVFFQWFVVPDVRNRLAKAAGAEVAVQQTDEKWHAAVARSTCASQNAQNTGISRQFWKFWSGKMVCHCGAKHSGKSKCTKYFGVGTILAVRNPEKWYATVARSAFASQNAQNTTRWDQFFVSGLEKWHAVARSTFASQNAQNTRCSGHFLTFRCRKLVS